MKSLGVEKPSVFGVTTLDTIRTKTFVGELKGVDPAQVDVQVVGGHSGPTIVPILSGVNGGSLSFTEAETSALVQRIQYGGDEVVKAKAGAGSATLSMAFAAREFYRSVVAAMDGAKPAADSVRPIAFVKTDKYEPGYFAAQIDLDRNGLKAVHGLPNLNEHEKKLLAVAINDLKKDVQKGVDFVKSHGKATAATI
jgi:malate dehydrogenase